jgi:arylsulfatase
MADEAIKWLRGLDAAASDQPFFLYYCPGGSHAPHQPTKEWIDKFKGKFDMGWNAMRDVIFANQKRLGVVPADAELTPGPTTSRNGISSRPTKRSCSPARPRYSRPILPTLTTRPAV